MRFSVTIVVWTSVSSLFPSLPLFLQSLFADVIRLIKLMQRGECDRDASISLKFSKGLWEKCNTYLLWLVCVTPRGLALYTRRSSMARRPFIEGQSLFPSSFRDAEHTIGWRLFLQRLKVSASVRRPLPRAQEHQMSISSVGIGDQCALGSLFDGRQRWSSLGVHRMYRTCTKAVYTTRKSSTTIATFQRAWLGSKSLAFQSQRLQVAGFRPPRPEYRWVFDFR